MSLFDLLVADAFGAVWLAAWFCIRSMRGNVNQRESDGVLYEAWARQVSAWNNDDTQLESLADLMPLAGEVLPKRQLVVDELGEWDPLEHREETPLLFHAMTYVFPVEQGCDWRPSWATPTGAWATVGAR
jgi:hypothetical protein